MCKHHYYRVRYSGNPHSISKQSPRQGTIKNNVFLLSLGNSTRNAIVDLEFSYLDKYNWNLSSKGYIRTSENYKEKSLHRMILKLRKGEFVDHINGDKLDNRLSNLRQANSQQNSWNRKSISKGGSSYKGVFWRKDRSCWVARIKVNGIPIYIGSSLDDQEAALMYDAAAIQLFGEYARLNLL